MHYKKRTHIRQKAFMILSAVVISTGFLLSGTVVQSETNPSCPSGISLGVSGANNTSGVTEGIVNVILGNPTGSNQTISKVVMRANSQPIGRAQPNSNYSWSMPWVTSLYPNGHARLDAEVYFSDSTQYCLVSGPSLTVLNNTAANLTAVAQPSDWQGPMSFSFPIRVNAGVQAVPFDPTPYSLYQWTATIGNINPSFNQAQFSSGQTEGSGSVTIKIKYGGDEAVISVPITVKTPSSPLPYSNSNLGSDAPSSTSSNQRPSTNGSTPPATLQNNPTAQDCIVGALGEERFKAINKSEVRPTPEEIKKFNFCFANSNYILPSNFAPVAPVAVKELAKSSTLALNKPENVSKQKETGKVDALKLGGKAAPNSLVLIYIFSDPLVLTSTADADGNWTYILEDPIEPGKHEVYSVVYRGDGIYERSNPISFLIGTAVAAEANPDGLSLRLADQPTPALSNRSMMVYAVASALTVLSVLLVLLVIIRRRKPKPTVTTPAPAAPQASPPDAATPTDSFKNPPESV